MEKRDLKEAIFSELFEDMHSLIAKVQTVHKEQQEFVENIGGIISDAANQIANELYSSVQSDIDKSHKTLDNADRSLTRTIDQINKMGSALKQLVERLEKAKSDSMHKYAIIAAGVFTLTSFVNFLIFFAITKMN